MAAKKAPAKKAPAKKTAAKRSVAAKKAPATKRATTARTTTAAKKAPTTKRATAARKTAAAKKAPARKTTAAQKTTAAKKAPARKAPARGAAATKAAPRATAGGGAAASTGGAMRTGPGTSRSALSSQVISSLMDQPERPGRSLVTSNHEVIQRWARERGAKPATIAGTEREGRVGVLTFNIPGYRESSRIREITWDDWFHTFDLRRLNLIYQEQLRDGRQSNFFRTESPDREDG
ncbi:hypothetical protein ACIBTV_01760 [Micromonospora sp. NPDC049366]|uniref:hypothetical protein n=1 Tax=Micromonospora sp. NPDC049366 TaxID=3364271 RepID=UPI0037947318